jgi:hypothetical protein
VFIAITYIYCQQILTFLGLISSFQHYFHLNVSHRTFLHHSSLCSHVNVHFLMFLTLLCMNLYEDIVEIVVKYNKNIRLVMGDTEYSVFAIDTSDTTNSVIRYRLLTCIVRYLHHFLDDLFNFSSWLNKT